MRTLLWLAAAAFLAGCATNPQTRDELKTMAANHPSMAIADSYTASRRLDDVAAAINRKWQECYAVRKTTTRTEGGMTTMRYRDTFHPKMRRVNNSTIEMTLQMTTEGMTMLSKTPEGGDYVVALDLHGLPGNKTKLSWYSPSWGWGDQWQLNKQWADGKNTACLR